MRSGKYTGNIESVHQRPFGFLLLLGNSLQQLNVNVDMGGGSKFWKLHHRLHSSNLPAVAVVPGAMAVQASEQTMQNACRLGD